MALHMCFDFLNVDSKLRTELLYYFSGGILVFDCRMTMMTDVRRGRKIKMTRVSLARRAACIQCYSNTRMLLATWNLILISALDTAGIFPPRCAWRGKQTIYSIECSFRQQMAKSPMQQDMKMSRQLKINIEFYVTHRLYTCFIEGQEF